MIGKLNETAVSLTVYFLRYKMNKRERKARRKRMILIRMTAKTEGQRCWLQTSILVVSPVQLTPSPVAFLAIVLLRVSVPPPQVSLQPDSVQSAH